MKRPSIQQALAKENPLVSPSAHDALSARMIEEAGFSSIAIGGSALLAARHALPDLGIAALGEMAAGARDILNACKLPCLIDGDDGYGGVKSVARTMAVYEGIGAGGVIFEDQLRAGKQPGDSAASSLASVDEMKAKLRAAVVARDNVDVLLIARTDAYAPEGLDAALARGYEYLSCGADGLLVPGVRRPEELERIGSNFRGVHLVVVATEGGAGGLRPAELGDLGFKQVLYPASLITRVAQALDEGLTALRSFCASDGDAPAPPIERARTILRDALGEDDWRAVETKSKR